MDCYKTVINYLCRNYPNFVVKTGGRTGILVNGFPTLYGDHLLHKLSTSKLLEKCYITGGVAYKAKCIIHLLILYNDELSDMDPKQFANHNNNFTQNKYMLAKHRNFFLGMVPVDVWFDDFMQKAIRYPIPMDLD